MFINPQSDGAFVAEVDRAMADGVDSAAELQARLRVTHPSVVVRERDLAGDPTPRWYVYRDGSWTPEDGDPGPITP